MGNFVLQDFSVVFDRLAKTGRNMGLMSIFSNAYSRRQTETTKDELFKAALKLTVSQRLRKMLFDDKSRHCEYLALLRESTGPVGIEAYASKLDSQLNGLCGHCDKARRSSENRITGADNPLNDLAVEVQNWAIAAAALKLSRGLDIDAAFEAGAPFEAVVNNRDYLLAVAKKNEGEDAFGSSVDFEVYAKKTAHEIAYKLLIQAYEDHFESDFWALVSNEAGNVHALERVAKASEGISQSSLEYWKKWRSV